MPSLQRISMVSALVATGGYYVLHRQLTQKYPNVALYELPPTISVKSEFPPKGSKTYIAYCDTFKTTVKTSLSKEQIADRILQWPTFKGLLKNEGSTSTGMIQGTRVSQKSTRNDASTVVKWWWNPTSGIVSGFEWLASYGYPWRMMNGGLHEVYVQGSNGVYDVYFITAHEYNDLRDGKLIPNFMQVLHQDFARVVLYFETKDL